MQYAEVGYGFESVIRETDNEIHISLILVDKEKRCHGIGTRYINEMISYSVRNNKSLTLNPSSLFGGNLKKLKKFYTRLGFQEIGDKWYYLG